MNSNKTGEIWAPRYANGGSFVADILKEYHQLPQFVIMYGGQGPKNYPKTKVFYPLLRLGSVKLSLEFNRNA